MRPFLGWKGKMDSKTSSKAEPGILIGNVHTLLVGGIEPNHQHRGLNVLLVDGGAPQPRLQGAEGRGERGELVV